MFKKIFSLVSLSVLAASCGKSAQAQELIYAPSETANLQDSQCGDQSKGKITCNTDNIEIYYLVDNILNNGWVNQNTGDIAGPFLNLIPGDGSFRSKDLILTTILGVTKMEKAISDDGVHYRCDQSKIGTSLYNFQITGDSNGQTQTIFESQATINKATLFSGYLGNDCTYEASLNGLQLLGEGGTQNRYQLLLQLLDPNLNNFQVKILNNTVKSISAPISMVDLKIIGNR